MSHLRISPDPEHLNASLATYLVAELEQVLKQGIKALTLALSGGRTPQGLLAQLVEKHSNSTLWKELKIIWVDERHVPFDDPDSNYGNALPFIDALGVPRDHIYPMGTNPDTVLAAREYHEFLLRLASQRPAGAALFDITLLAWERMVILPPFFRERITQEIQTYAKLPNSLNWDKRASVSHCRL